MNPKRKANCLKLWRQNSDPEYWKGQIKVLAENDYCNGANERTWIARFDYFIRPETQTKIVEGVYSKRKSTKPKIMVPMDEPHAL